MKLILPVILAGLLATPAAAKVCRDLHGRIVKCIQHVGPPPPGCRDRHGHLVPCTANGNRTRHRGH